MTLPIIQTGDPILRECARELTRKEIRSRKIQSLIDEMRETMHAAPGVGLAAPQIGQSIRLVVIEDSKKLQKQLTKEQLAERERVPIPFHVLVNPRLRVRKKSKVEFFEGCLSINGYTAVTPRYHSLTVNAINEHGEEFERSAHGWYARILQHETDHLDGVLYIDRMIARTFSTLSNKEQFWS